MGTISGIGVLCICSSLIAIVNQWSYLFGGKTHSRQESTQKYSLSHKLPSTEPETYLHRSNEFGLRQTLEVDESINMTKRRPTQTILISANQTVHSKHYNRAAFLKVHKAGSSTAQNIFLRYGESRNLTFVLSIHREGHYDNVIATQTSLNNNNTLPPPPNKTFDILCCHVLYNREVFQTYMPNDTAYVAIVREPFDHFLSTLNYFRVRYIFKKITVGNNVLEYLRDPWKYERGINPHWSFTNNRMAVEFDFPENLFRNYSKEESMAYLEKLNKEFHLVIILEYFVESVVLMRRILGWKVKDILYLKKNAAKQYSFVDNTHRYLYERFAKLDYDLYNFFNRRLWQQIHHEGIDFHLEVLYFRRLRKEVEDYCLYGKSKVDNYTVPASKWDESFNVTHLDCQFLKMHEMAFVSKIRKRQYG